MNEWMSFTSQVYVFSVKNIGPVQMGQNRLFLKATVYNILRQLLSHLENYGSMIIEI